MSDSISSPPRRPTHHRPAPRRQDRQRGHNIVYIVIAAIVIVSMLAVGLSRLDLSQVANQSTDPPFDPNADVLSTQEALVTQQPDDLDALLLLANFYANSNQTEQALTTFEHAVSLAPDDPQVRFDYARALQEGGYQADAEQQFLAAIRLDPNNQNAHYYLADLYLNWSPSRRDDARAEYERCVEINPTSFRGERAQAMLDAWDSATPPATPSSE